MKIDSLTIENFKCFKAEKTFDFGRITILTGANSSGKSSVMYAILMALQSENFPKKLSINGEYVDLGDFKQIANQHDASKIIKIGYRFDKYDYDFISYWSEDEVSFQPKLEKIDIPTKNGVLNTLEDLKFLSLHYPIKEYRGRVNYLSASRPVLSRTYLEKNRGDFKVDIEGSGYLDQIIDWEKVKSPKLMTLIKIMSDLSLIEEMKTKRLDGGRFEMLVRVKGGNVLTSLNNVGYSVSQFLPVLVADLQLPNDSTLFLAEPEIHLHPSVQSKFGDYIINQVNTSDKNYVIETHSEYFLNKIRLAIVKGELKKEDIKVYFLENNGDDTDVFDIDFRKNGGIRNAPDSFFETYLSDTMAIAMNSFAE